MVFKRVCRQNIRHDIVGINKNIPAVNNADTLDRSVALLVFIVGRGFDEGPFQKLNFRILVVGKLALLFQVLDVRFDCFDEKLFQKYLKENQQGEIDSCIEKSVYGEAATQESRKNGDAEQNRDDNSRFLDYACSVMRLQVVEFIELEIVAVV